MIVTLSRGESRGRSAFHDNAFLLHHFSSEAPSTGVATLQVQLCEFNQFRKWCSRMPAKGVAY